MKILILEDYGFRVRFFIERFGNHDLKITENAKDAIEYLKEFTFNYLFLDNDLGPGNGEGVDVAEFLQSNENNANNNAITIIHSWNRPATERIKSRLPNAISAPFNTDCFFNLNLDI
jgi:ActR/RegA family two-component response regulator